MGLVAGHLFPEGHHRRIFQTSRHSAAMALILWTALRLVDARLAVAEFGLRQKLGMTFGFRHFDGERPTEEKGILDTLDRKMKWDEVTSP